MIVIRVGVFQRTTTSSTRAGATATTAGATTATSSIPFLFASRRFAGHARPTPTEIAGALNQLNATISEVGDVKEFKKKYLALVRQHHPDKGGSEEKMKNLTTSYDLLTSLSDGERREYGSRKNYSAATSAGANHQRARREAYANRNQQSQQAYDFQDLYRKGYEQNTGFAQSANYSTYKGSGSQKESNDPFQSQFYRGGPYTGTSADFTKSYYEMRRTPMSIIFMRALVMYGILVFFIVLFQRSSEDFNNQKGWTQAQQTAAQDRVNQIYEQRNEFLDRLKNRDMMRRMESEREKEKRVFDYASRRSAELSKMEYSSFPPLPPDGSMGTVFKVPADPVGILYYEPPMKNTFQSHMNRRPSPSSSQQQQRNESKPVFMTSQQQQQHQLQQQQQYSSSSAYPSYPPQYQQHNQQQQRGGGMMSTNSSLPGGISVPSQDPSTMAALNESQPQQQQGQQQGQGRQQFQEVPGFKR